MARIAAEPGYDLSRQIATQITADDLAWADDVLVMDDENISSLPEGIRTSFSMSGC
jgi:protein-tyrosine-phosphatase